MRVKLCLGSFDEKVVLGRDCGIKLFCLIIRRSMPCLARQFLDNTFLNDLGSKSLLRS